MTRQRLFAALVGTALLAAPVLAGSKVKDASTRTQEDSVTAAAARLSAAVDRAENAQALDAAQRSQRSDLLGRAKDLTTEAATTMRQGDSRDSLVTHMDAVTTALIAIADASVIASGGSAPAAGDAKSAPFGEAPDAGAGLDNPHVATACIRFHDVAAQVRGVLGGLSDDERADARQLIQSGEDVVAMVKAGKPSDHGTRTAHVRSLEDITQQLAALYQTGLEDRRKGQPFVPSWRTPEGWVPVSAKAEGLQALRVSFVRPGTAWVVLQNDGDAPRKFFTELQFTDHVGESTGSATLESGAFQELKPHEVRRVEVPIIPTNPRFWDETTGFTIYVE
jgi:hypothetical protein